MTMTKILVGVRRAGFGGIVAARVLGGVRREDRGTRIELNCHVAL